MDTTDTPNKPVGDAISEISTRLVTLFGLPVMHAEVFSLAALSAAIGTNRGVVDPAGGILPPTLQIVGHGQAQITLQSALRGAFNPIHEVQGARYHESMLKGEDHAREQILGVQKEISRCRGEIEKADQALNPVLSCGRSVYDNADDILSFNQVVNPGLVRQKEKLKNRVVELQKRLRQLNIALNPVVVVGSLRPGEIRTMRNRSLDGILFNLDERGVSLRELLAMNLQRRREICSATAAMLDHAVVRPEDPGRGPLGHAGASVVTGYLAAKLIRNKEFRASGLLDHLIFLRLDEVPQLEGPAEMPGEGSVAGCLVQQLMLLRSEDKSAVINLSVAARESYWTFHRQIEKLAVNEPEDSQCRLSLLPQLALKFALLYHIGAGGLDEPEISAASFDKSRELARSIYEHQKIARQISADQAVTDKCFDLEVLKLVAQIRKMENPSRREIARTYHDQDYARLGPLLAKAQADGWIREVDGRYAAVAQVSAAA